MKRCDHLPLRDPNPGKVRALRALLRAFRRAAPDVAADQWRRFFETGKFAGRVSAREQACSVRLTRAKAALGAQRLQMLQHQVAGQLEAFIANQSEEFRDTVLSARIDDDTRHQLLVIGKLRAWFRPGPVVMSATGREIPPDVRRLARRIMHGVLARHRRPRFHRLNPWIDQRQARLGPSLRAGHAGLWLGVRGLDPMTGWSGRGARPQRMIHVPLGANAAFEARGGAIAKTVQLIERGTDAVRPGELVIGVVSDMSVPFEASRKAYRPLRDELALDFGLTVMFATPDGDLLGRAWFEQLRRHDDRISGLACRLQRQGIRPNRSVRYRARVAAFRGGLRTEIGRVLNRLIRLRRPASIVIERLDFRAPGLSARLNRILARSGCQIIRAKLRDAQERFGITFAEVNPAYSSQTCSACGHVARANRRTRSDFSCRACGHGIHADVNAARNLEGGRSAFDRRARHTKAESLRLTVLRHLERDRTRGWVTPARVLDSPYYRDVMAAPDIVPIGASGPTGPAALPPERRSPGLASAQRLGGPLPDRAPRACREPYPR